MKPSDNRERAIYKVTLVGSVVNLFLVAFKFAAGILGHSSAMIADAVHSFSDFISDIVVIVFVRLSSRPQDADHDYGHGKYETMASLIVGIMLLLAAIGILFNGVEKSIRCFNGEDIGTPHVIALIAAVLSIILKEGIYRYTIICERKINSPALRANAWHHRSDALTSIAAFIGIGGAMLFGPGWQILDPLAAALVSLFILKASYELIRPNIDDLLEKSLPDSEKQQITNIIMSVSGIVKIHRLRTRRVGPHIAVEAHLKMDGRISLYEAHEIATEAEKRLRETYGNGIHIGFHMEPINK